MDQTLKVEALAKRRDQNRRAQRNYRNNIKKHIKGLEVLNSALMQPYTLTPDRPFDVFSLDGSSTQHPFSVGSGTTKVDEEDADRSALWQHGPFGPSSGSLASPAPHYPYASFTSPGYSNDQNRKTYGYSQHMHGSQAGSPHDSSSTITSQGEGLARRDTVHEHPAPVSSGSFGTVYTAPVDNVAMARSSQALNEMVYPGYGVAGSSLTMSPPLDHVSPDASSSSPSTPSVSMPVHHQPLLHAIHHGRTHLVQLLIEHSADPNKPGPDGRTPLHIAAMAGNVDIVHLLLQRGAALEAVDSEGCTALILAVINNHYPVVATLLESGANVNG